MRIRLVSMCVFLVACGSSSNESAPCETDAAPRYDAATEVDASNPGIADAAPCPDASLPDASVPDASDASSDAAPDCDADHYRGTCLDAEEPSAWGFDARCTSPYKYQGPIVNHRLNGLDNCVPATTSGGMAVLCCPDGG